MTEEQNDMTQKDASTPSEEIEQAETEDQPKKKKRRPREWNTRRVFVLVFLLLLLGGMFNSAARPVDDAYITYRYAENLVEGNGLAYNVGTRVEGYTSIAQVLIAALFRLAGKQFVIFGTMMLGVIAWALAIALLWQFMRRQRQGELDRPDWFLILYLAFCHPAVIWSFSGMETTMLALAWVAAWFFHLREYEQDDWPYLSGLLSAAAGLLHPEGIIIAVVLGASWFLPYKPERLKKALVYLAIALGVFGLYWLWRWSYFGYFFPNTFYNKVGLGGGLFFKGFRYLWVGAVSSIVPIYLIYLAFRRRADAKTWPRWLVLSFGLIGILCLYCLLVGGDYFTFQRFLLPILPFTLLATWKLWYDHREAKAQRQLELDAQEQADESIAPEEPKYEPGKRHPVLWSLMIVFLIMFWSGLFKLQMVQHRLIQRVVPDYADAGKILNRQLPDDAQIATIPIGAFGYFVERPIIDIPGLTDTHVSHLSIPTGQRNVGHEKFDYDYVLRRQPEIILRQPTLLPYGEQWLNNWLLLTTLNPIQYRLYEYPKLNEDYRLAWLQVKKRKVRLPKTLKAEPMMVGMYGYIRRDLVKTEGYKKWRVLPSRWTERLQWEISEKIKSNPMRKLRGTSWSFTGGEDTDLPDATPTPPPEPQALTPPEAVETPSPDTEEPETTD